MKKLNESQVHELRTKLNKIYDEVEEIDAKIDLLTLKRNDLVSKIEAGAAILLKYGDVDED